MKITKFEHACFVVEQDGESLIVDPGEWTTDLVIPENVKAVVVTHEHFDHMSKDLLRAIVDKNPDVVIVGHQDIIPKLDNFKTRTVVADQRIKAGNFKLEFFGGKHAVITRGWPVVANLGVMINNRLYYPGDSFTDPGKPVEILALPVAAPWLKFNEAVDLLMAVKPKFAFPTHDAILSDNGKDLADRMFPPVAQKIGAEYRRIDSSPLEV